MVLRNAERLNNHFGVVIVTVLPVHLFKHCSKIVTYILLRVQLDPSSLLATVPLPISQVILLQLVQYLSFDLQNDTGHKLLWIKEAALALNPEDPRLVPHMRAFLEPTYQNCHKLMGVTNVQSEQSMLRLVIHLINSLLSSCT